jgi:5-hydroxyisourate hydrolase
MGKLTTHVLDTTLGKPAGGLVIELWHGEKHITTVTTNADGRAIKPVLEGDAFKVGWHELRFHAGDYLRREHKLTELLFLDVIPIRFGVTDASQHYHVPLLLSPFGYSTYRGS